jgi:signal transduction histidine kinase
MIAGLIVQRSRRERAERRFRQSQATLRELAGKLLGAEENERRRIARELHDDLGQSLSLLSVELDMLQQKPSQESADLAARIRKLSARVKQLSSSVHDLSHQLHPMKLEQLGLVAAMKSLCKELSETHELPISFEYDELPGSISSDDSLCLYRVAQEALQNVIKHSRANSAMTDLRCAGDFLVLTIRDNGRGLDLQSAIKQGGLGLASMKERVRLVNGDIEFTGIVPSGTQVEVRIPLATSGSARPESQDGSALNSTTKTLALS